MKRYLLPSILFLLAVASGFSQAPPRFNYQAVARDASGAFISEKPVSVKISILEGNATGNLIYTETQATTTNKFGLFSLQIGKGDPTKFSTIDWSSGSKFIDITVNNVSIGTAQLLSVPYALYAENAGKVATGTSGDAAGKKYFEGIKGISIDSSVAGTIKITNTIDTAKYAKAPNALTTADAGKILVWNGTAWILVASPNYGGGGIEVKGQRIIAKVDGVTIDTVKGFLRVRRPRLDSLDLSLKIGEKENFILKVQDGKLKFVQDTAYLKSINAGWSLTGNVNTKAGVNYIGTNDKVGFKIKTAGTTRMTFDAIGNVLFGTPPTDSSKAPRAVFEQRGTVNGTAAIFGGEGFGISMISSTNSSGIGFNQYSISGGKKIISTGYSGFISLQVSSGDMIFGSSSSGASESNVTLNNVKMILSNTGQLGIGSFNPINKPPTHKLTVEDDVLDSNFVRFIGYGKKASQLLYVDVNGIVRDTGFSALSGSSGWSLTGNKGTTNSNFIGTAEGNGDSLRFYTNGIQRMVIASNGSSTNVGIGQKSISGFALAVNGKIKTANITESSDIRYKKNIHPIANALDKVQKLTGVSYNWRQTEFPEMNFEKGTDIGLIAQEVEKVLPELVNTDDQGYKSVEYSHLVSVLVEAIKDQQKQIEDLKSVVSEKNTTLQKSDSRIKSLESSVSTLSSQMQLLLDLVGKTAGVKASK